MHALKTMATLAAVTLTVNACASSGASLRSASLPDGPSAGIAETKSGTPVAQPATLRVSNYNWMDVVVYAVQGNSRVRLGQVTTMGTGTFRIPARMLNNAVGNVRLMVDPVGSTQGWQSDGILVHAGEQVQFNVQNSLPLSSVMVASR
ncbi:MAG TPA: hypothetical protein VJT67_17950 [Longimicrobiaceae bacterium]|nr:hypothetical protein [Longimicrobiaceae bacterium]